MTVFTVQVDDNQAVSVGTRGDLWNVIDSFVDEKLDKAESEIKVTISSQQMTKEEYDALPEFDGF